MTDLQKARVEAAAKAIANAGLKDPLGWENLGQPLRNLYSVEAHAALAAADAVVTVEQIAPIARSAFHRWFNEEDDVSDDIELGEYIASAVVALLRGEATP